MRAEPLLLPRFDWFFSSFDTPGGKKRSDRQASVQLLESRAVVVRSGCCADSVLAQSDPIRVFRHRGQRALELAGSLSWL